MTRHLDIFHMPHWNKLHYYKHTNITVHMCIHTKTARARNNHEKKKNYETAD